MPPKKGQGKQSNFYKVGMQVKDIVPPTEKNQPREGKQQKQIEPVSQIPKTVLFENFKDVEEWPGDEQVLAHDFQLNGTQVFNEGNPLTKDYVKVKCSQEQIVFWRRPQDYIKDEQDTKVEIEQMIQIRRRGSYTQQSPFSFGNGAEDSGHSSKLQDDTSAYRKHKTDYVKGEYIQPDTDQSPNQNQQKLQQQQEPEESEKKLQIKVCEIFEREETEQEVEQRIKEQEQKALDTKAKKKAPKKGEEVNDGPQKKKDVKLSNIDMSYDLLNDFKWMASQLQLIKDRNLRDIHTHKPIWSKVYPQQEGVPVYNQSGKYWVKLYYMGKERKIEIDDKMPVNVKGECYFPKSVKREEIWQHKKSLLVNQLTSYSFQGVYFNKGSFQTYMSDSQHNKLIQSNGKVKQTFQFYQIQCYHHLFISGFIVYALTGMLSETLPIQGLDKEKSMHNLQFIKGLLSEESHLNNDVFVTCYCNTDYKPVAESNLKREAKEFYIDQVREGNQVYQNSEDEEVDDQDEGSSDIKRGNNLETIEEEEKISDFRTSPFKSRYQHNIIPETMDSPTKIKSKMAFQRKASLREKPTFVIPGYSYPVVESFFNNTFNMVYVQKRSDKEVKLRQEYFELSKINMHKFTKDEKLEHRRKKKEIREKITECDKTRVALITKPPIQYKLFRIKTNAARCPHLNIQCPFTSQEIVIAKTCLLNSLSKPPNYEVPEIKDDGKSMISTVKNQDETFIMRPLEDFSSLSHLKKPLNRGLGGSWVKDIDVLGCFQYFQIFYNPKKLQNSKDVFIKANPDLEITDNKEHEILLVHTKKNEQAEDEEEQDTPVDEDVKLIFGFQPQQAVNQEFSPPPYCILQKFDFEIYDTVLDYPVLKERQQSQLVSFKNQNTVFRIMSYSPMSYMLNIACSNSFETMSVPQYLTDYENYQLKTCTIDYPTLEENKYVNLVRFKIQPSEKENIFILQVNSNNDNYMLKYFRYKIFEEPEQGEQYMLQSIEGVNKNLYENTLTNQNYLRIILKPQKVYNLLIEGKAPYNVNEGQLSCEFFYQNPDFQVDQVELTEPLEYTDQYQPTKYGIIFREKIYSGENTTSSVYLRISKVLGAGNQQTTDKKAVKKGEQVELVEQEIQEQRLIKLELFEGDKLIQYSYGYNQVFLSNIILKQNKDDSLQYYLQASFDLRQWEGCKTQNEETANLQWFLRVQSSDTLVIVKDTVKEDREKSIIKSWEDSEPGRAAKAKVARQKYQLYLKQKNGEELTEEEQALLKEPRLSKKQRDEEQQAGQKGGKKQTKKDDKKVTKKGGKGVEQVEVIEERPLPESVNHRMNEIQSFLSHMEQERVVEILAKHQGLINIRSQENKTEIKETAQISLEEFEALLQRNKLLQEELLELQKQQQDIIMQEIQNSKEEYKKIWDSYSGVREEIKGKMQEKSVKEKEMIGICSQDKPQIDKAGFEKLIQEAQEIPEFNQALLDLAQKVLINIQVYALSDKIQNALAIFDVETLKQCIQEFQEFSVTGISPELIEQSEAMLEEAADNPNFQAEKSGRTQKKLEKRGKK